MIETRSTEIPRKVKELEKGKSFIVATKEDRQVAVVSGRILRAAEVIAHDIITRKTEGGFIVAAI